MSDIENEIDIEKITESGIIFIYSFFLQLFCYNLFYQLFFFSDAGYEANKRNGSGGAAETANRTIKTTSNNSAATTTANKKLNN